MPSFRFAHGNMGGGSWFHLWDETSEGTGIKFDAGPFRMIQREARYSPDRALFQWRSIGPTDPSGCRPSYQNPPDRQQLCFMLEHSVGRMRSRSSHSRGFALLRHERIPHDDPLSSLQTYSCGIASGEGSRDGAGRHPSAFTVSNVDALGAGMVQRPSLSVCGASARTMSLTAMAAANSKAALGTGRPVTLSITRT